jgi:hypothetical protein
METEVVHPHTHFIGFLQKRSSELATWLNIDAPFFGLASYMHDAELFIEWGLKGSLWKLPHAEKMEGQYNLTAYELHRYKVAEEEHQSTKHLLESFIEFGYKWANAWCFGGSHWPALYW